MIIGTTKHYLLIRNNLLIPDLLSIWQVSLIIVLPNLLHNKKPHQINDVTFLTLCILNIIKLQKTPQMCDTSDCHHTLQIQMECLQIPL